MKSKYQEQLQPSLLDRLIDDEPSNTKETSDHQTISMRNLRKMVLRDLAWLFNTTNLEAAEDLAPYPEVQDSVLNYGICELSGRLVAGMDHIALERLLKKAIQEFEPRVQTNTVKVRTIANDKSASSNRVVFEIEGKLWALPTPTNLLLRTQVDLEEGAITVADAFSTGKN